VAPDAVVVLVERADEIGTRIGESETPAPADVLGSDRVSDDALPLAPLRVHEEIVRIDPGRSLEEDASLNVFAPGGRWDDAPPMPSYVGGDVANVIDDVQKRL